MNGFNIVSPTSWLRKSLGIALVILLVLISSLSLIAPPEVQAQDGSNPPDNSPDITPDATPPEVSVSVEPDKDAEITSFSGKITVNIPKGAVNTVTDVSMREYPATDSTGTQTVALFELNAKETSSEMAVNRFNKELEITINHTPEELSGLDLDSLYLYYLDEKTQQWEPVPSRFDRETLTLTATIDHFSYFGEQANPLQNGPGRVMAADVNLHSGTATYSYPIELPPGPGGFQPSLALAYNSGAVDGMKNKRDVGSWVGTGWSLNPGSITLDSLSNTYYLNLSGVSYELYSISDTEYRTKPDEYFKITRSGNTWTLLDRSGNYYQFGSTTDATQYYDSSNYYRWDLSYWKDTNGNEATISYVRDIYSNSVRSAYPEYLRYNNNLVEVHFISSYDENGSYGPVRDDNPISYGSNPVPKIMENRSLDAIEIKVSGSLIRKYTFTYNTTDRVYSSDYGGIYYAGKHTLTSITQVGADGSSTLPAITFTYQDKEVFRKTSSSQYTGNPGNPASLTWPFLTAINSGYGGSVGFTYTQIPANTTYDIWTRQAVTTKTVNSGIGSTETYTYTYTGNPAYKGVDWYQEFRGWNEVRETDAAGNYVKHWFYTTGTIGGKDAEKLTGREYKTEWYSSTSTLLDTKTYDWNIYPSAVNDMHFLSKWGAYGTGDGQFNSPYGMARDSSGNFYVTEASSHYVQKFTSTGEFITKWGSQGSGDGQFQYPYAIAIDANDNVYVVDTGNQRIQKFSSSGTFITKWGSSGYGNGQFVSPEGIAFDASGYIYVTDVNRIQKFDTDGTYITQLGSAGSGDGQFNLPKGIAVDANGNVYVVDRGNSRILKFDSSGTFLTKWGSFGAGDGQFRGPYAIAVDASGNVFVTDFLYSYYNDNVQKFDANGNFLTKWGTYGTENGNFRGPTAVMADANGYVTVLDNGNQRVQVFTPYKISHEFALQWGTYGSEDGNLNQPLGLVTDSSQLVYVVDSGNHRVQVFDSHGEFSHKWGSQGSGDGQFNWPYWIAIDSDNNIYVTETYSHRVQKFTSSGEFITKWGSQGSGDGQFQYPGGIAIDADDNVYVADYGNCRIQKFNSSGTFIAKWGSYGSGNGQFLGPEGIASDASGYIYVTDYSGSRVQKFDTDGTYITKWGSGGTGDGQFSLPRGIAVDASGNVYVVDWGNDRIQKFDSSGNFLTKWGSSGTGEGQFAAPYGIAIDTEMNIYVSDPLSYVAGIQKFSIPESLWVVHLDKIEETVGTKTSRTEYVYDSYGNVITEKHHGDISTNADDATIHRLYYPNITANILNRPVRERVYATITDDVGGTNLKQETLFYYDGNNTSLTTPPTKGNLTRLEQYKDASNTVSTYFTYDTYGNILTEQDPNGNTTTRTYDTTYHTYPATMTLPVTGLSESYTYAAGTTNLLSMTDANGQTTTYEYDTFQRLIKVIKPGDSSASPSVQYQYNNWGTLNQQHIKTITKVDTGDSLWQSQYFDGLGRVVQVHAEGEAGHTIVATTTVFNNRGLVDKEYVSQDIASVLTSYQTPDGGWKYASYTYDGLGRVLTQTGADGTSVSHDYATAWQELTTNERGYKTRYYYDAFNRLTKVEELNESHQLYATTTYAYDVLGNLVQVVDNSSNTTTMTYDRLSRKTGMSDPDMGSWTYGYDNNGNLTTQTDAKSQTITMVYDALNRLNNKNYPGGSGMTNVVYSYDSTSGGNYGKGQITAMTDAIGTTTYKYDTRGRLIEEKRTVDTVDYITTFTYDGADRTVTITYPSGETVTQSYDGRGFPYALSGSVAGDIVTSTLYNHLSQITEMNLNNGLKNIFGYYDTGGTYDTTGGYYGRLWRIATTDGVNDLMDIRHTWDAGGNLTSRQDILASETESFTYDFLDRLTGVSGPYSASYSYNQIGNITSMNGNSYTYGTKPHAVTAVGATSYAYDTNGNMTTRGSQTITWDVENRPVSVANGGTATFVYDGNGNRAQKTEGGETVLYINRYYEKNLTTGEVTTYYYLGNRLVAMKQDSDLTYLHQDHLTGTSLATDTNGDQVGTTVKYLPYGETRAGAVPTDKLFTGQRLDETGLYYYGARYYDPAIGRFISADATIPDGMDPQSYNRYSYCINNPISAIDPNGKDYVFVCGSGGMPTEWLFMMASLNVFDENYYVVWETSADTRGWPWEIQDQVQGLTDLLASTALTNIKLIGHSEGAASIISVLDKLANDDDFLGSTNVRDELKAAVMLEAPTSISDSLVSGWDDNTYYDLPRELAGAEMEVKLLDVWNKASVAHLSGPMPGWSEKNTYSYDSRSFWTRAGCWIWPTYWLADKMSTMKYHNDPLTNPNVTSVIKDFLND